MQAPQSTRRLEADLGPGSRQWRTPAANEILGHHLPHLGPGDRLLLRALTLCAARYVVAIEGLQHIRPAQDPFILVANHSTRREAVPVPAMLLLLRGGRRVHFLADWNFRLIPGVGFLYARAEVVTVTRKSAKPRFLNALKPLYAPALPTLERARAHLVAGQCLGIFPEGEVNRDPFRLLRGRRGAARLSLETGAPVIPMGIRFPQPGLGGHLSRTCAMELHIAPPLIPRLPQRQWASVSAVSEWHGVIMTEIGRLANKAWPGAGKGDAA
ncbi:MAG TPA: lysophospholipid acyltransferase family protein [Hyphomicrobiaceae bacterium]|nr:lysophospholipid acyltransferase family protein [Hyphomicrobiaceae bacterium]